MASVSATAAVQAEAKLAAVAEIVARGKAEMAADMNGNTFVSFEEALRMAQEAQLLVATEDRVDLELGVEEEVSGNGSTEAEVKNEGRKIS